MNIEEAYKHWAGQYDTDENKTRDLEAISLREMLKNIPFKNCLEIGCGTGKNTEWLITKGDKITAVDLSEEMLAKAREKISDERVRFVKADINQPWTFTDERFDLVVCSLVLEHIEDINRLFKLISAHMTKNGLLYIGELHPFKQYTGSQAKFETEEGTQTVTAFVHHLTDYTLAAKENKLKLLDIKEYFDGKDTTSIPRILAMTFTKE